MNTCSSNCSRYRVEQTPIDLSVYKTKEIRKDEKESLLSVIFAPDPVTRLPKSDYAVYLSNKTNPVVREYVSANLLRPTNAKNVLPSGFDEDLSEFQRGEYETSFEYSQRIGKCLQEMKQEMTKSKD